MKNILLIIIIILSYEIFPQSKYIIFLTDKDVPENSSLSKSFAYYQQAVSLLSERVIERRLKVLDDDALISFEDLPLKQEYIDQLENLNIKLHHTLKWFNAVSAYLTEEQLALIKTLSFVKKVERVKVFKYKNEVEDKAQMGSELLKADLDYGPSFGQYALSGIQTLHELGIAGEGVIIGLLDSGFDWKNHESLTGAKVLAEYDFIFNDEVTANESEDASSQHNHGTTVFSVIGGYKEGKIIGPSYKASFLLAKTEYNPTETHAEEDNYAAALEWMENLGVDITSSSLGYSNGFEEGEGDYTYKDMDGKTTIVTRAAELAFERGVLTISSAGNEGDKAFHFISAPSDGINTISVAAVNSQNQVPAFSSRGPSYDRRIKPDVAAQGVDVYGASASGFSTYGLSNGTSLAAPIVSGIAGQILSAFPYLTNVELRKILLESGDSFSTPDSIRGYGLLSASQAYSVYVYFPQLLSTSLVTKRFNAEKGIKQSSVKLTYTIKGTTNEVTLSPDTDQSYDFNFSGLSNGATVNFYYTYLGAGDSTFREPAEGTFYSFAYGDQWIRYSSMGSEGYSLSNNFPNPFNYETKTQIRFTAKGGEKAELVIIDGIGQKVKMLFNGIAKPGINELTWDGFTDNDNPCASGVYFYFLKIAGKDFGNKMILLK